MRHEADDGEASRITRQLPIGSRSSPTNPTREARSNKGVSGASAILLNRSERCAARSQGRSLTLLARGTTPRTLSRTLWSPTTDRCGSRSSADTALGTQVSALHPSLSSGAKCSVFSPLWHESSLEAVFDAIVKAPPSMTGFLHSERDARRAPAAAAPTGGPEFPLPCIGKIE